MKSRNMRRTLLGVSIVVLGFLAYGVTWYSRGLDTAARGTTRLLERLPLVSDSGAQAIASGSGLFVHDTMVAVLETIKKIPFSVGNQDTTLLLSGVWLSPPPASMLNDSTLTVSVKDVPGAGSPVTGLLSSGLRGEFLGVVSLENPAMVVRLQLVRR